MPDIIVHDSMGSKVLKALSPEIWKHIDQSIFRLGLIIPDVYAFYRFFARPFRLGINKRSSVIHGSNTGLFLLKLTESAKDDDTFSFLAGFLCHYALDSITHPYINELSKDELRMHMAIEHRLDLLELSAQGKDRNSLMDVIPEFQGLPIVSEIFNTVYGWDIDYLHTSYRHMRLFYWLAKDRSGLLDFILRRGNGTSSAVSYRSHLCDDIDLSGFIPLEKQAVAFSVQLISKAYAAKGMPVDDPEYIEMVNRHTYDGTPIRIYDSQV